MTINPRADKLADEHDLELLAADGLDDALVGYVERCGSPACLVYDAEKVIGIFEEQFGSREAALEWFEFNVLGAYGGETTPYYLWKIDE